MPLITTVEKASIINLRYTNTKPKTRQIVVVGPYVMRDEAEDNLLAGPVEGTQSTQTHLIANCKVIVQQNFTFGFVMFPSEKSNTSGLVPPAFTCGGNSISSANHLRNQH